MVLCFAYAHFVLVDDPSNVEEIVKCFWKFKIKEFPRLLNNDFNILIYKDMYVKAFQLCY